ncbi:hypothetical protein NIIDNTM18_39790 [Mycolicibacterium litorale]|uniref:Uncharacterized protein n=1 Tax=Mycolicibacterium litorale TaxID=758802 RepID=A0A6S6PAH8_9MYCO|nr:hypothetical protein NIIDNTM18_39790 [Mycolicibacterium litorale]
MAVEEQHPGEVGTLADDVIGRTTSIDEFATFLRSAHALVVDAAHNEKVEVAMAPLQGAVPPFLVRQPQRSAPRADLRHTIRDSAPSRRVGHGKIRRDPAPDRSRLI